MYCNHPNIEMKFGEKVRWYVLALGNMVDLHTAQWDGQTVTVTEERTVDSISLLPSSMVVADQHPDECGQWPVHCAVGYHTYAGMMLRTSIEPSEMGLCYPTPDFTGSCLTVFVEV